MTDLTGQRLGQYELHAVIRRGGMATVYKAHQRSLDRWVAVKVLERSSDPEFVARFRREARSVAQLLHPNIVPVIDYGEDDGRPYLVIQYVDGGRTLGDLMGAPLEPARSIRLLLHLLEALGYAHQRGIVHRDVKPGNVLLPTPDWPMLSDFGIVKLLLESDQTQLTQQGLIVGTAAYMAPEQAFGLAVDARTDLYSAAVVLYELACGQVPFEADTPVSVLMKHAYEPPPPPRRRNPELPEELERVLLRALAKRPDDRYPTAAEMAADLDQVLAALRPRPAARQQRVEARRETRPAASTDTASPGPTPPARRPATAPSAATAPVADPPTRPAAAPPVTAAPAAPPAPDSPATGPRPAPSPSPHPSRWWLLLVVALLGFALTGPAVIVQRHLAPPSRGSGAAGAAGIVTMAGLAFMPGTLVVERGATVVFRNDDQAPHTVTADSSAFDSGALAPGATFSIAVTRGLTYHCTIHAFMAARIYVAS